MMSAKVRWGIVGTGTVANQFASDFKYTQNAQLIAVASRTEQSAKNFANKFGLPHYYDDYQTMLQEETIDVIYIATPHHRHKEDCLQAFAAKKAVLCEKPLTLCKQEAETIIHSARQHNLFCMEAMWMRFMPLLKQIKQNIENGSLGKITSLYASFAYPVEFKEDSRFFNLNEGGGSLLDRGVYPLSLAYYLLGQPLQVSGEAQMGSTGVDETCHYQLQYPQAVVAYLSASLRYRSSNEAYIFGDNGWIHIQEPFYRPESITLHKGVAPEQIIKKAQQSLNPQNALLRKVTKKTLPFLNKLNTKTESYYSPISGYGYQFEIDEVSRCFQSNLKESDLMKLDETLEIIESMDKLRHKWGIFYPHETKM